MLQYTQRYIIIVFISIYYLEDNNNITCGACAMHPDRGMTHCTDSGIFLLQVDTFWNRFRDVQMRLFVRRTASLLFVLRKNPSWMSEDRIDHAICDRHTDIVCQQYCTECGQCIQTSMYSAYTDRLKYARDKYNTLVYRHNRCPIYGPCPKATALSMYDECTANQLRRMDQPELFVWIYRDLLEAIN